jgi:hypothetical protein
MKYLKSFNLLEKLDYDRSEYYTRTTCTFCYNYIHPNSTEESRSKIKDVTPEEITKLEKVCGFKLKKDSDISKRLRSDKYPIPKNIGIDYIYIYEIEDEWYIVVVDYCVAITVNVGFTRLQFIVS